VPDGPRELRVVLTVPDHDTAVRFYRDVLGLREEASFTDDNGGRATLLHAGRATVEVGDEAHAEAIDQLEVGSRVAGPVRLAFEVTDAEEATHRLQAAGARRVAGPTSTPWGSVNARLDGPDGQQLTVYANDHYLTDRPRLDSTVHLAEPDPGWAETGAGLVQQVREALGPVAVVVAHAGSTSVPGLAAKPVIDLVLGVPDPADEATYVPALEGLGYALRIREPEWREHRLLRHTDPVTNLHVFASGDDEISRMLAFRDHLRLDARDRATYEQTKRDLAARTWDYVQDYADAKSDVVADVMSRALARDPDVRGWTVHVDRGRTSATSAADLAAALGLPLLDADRVATVTGLALIDADAAVLALAGDGHGAVVRTEGPAGQLGDRVVEAALLPGEDDLDRLARTVRQVAAAGS
jgi:GrpB-like predicted nucleotidyltransferase (UPF0157 family)/predicted enzyme related to lactoylglutathione lyase